MIKNIFRNNKAHVPRERIDFAGFSLLEVVITTAIIVVGLLGVSSLVTQNLRVQRINHHNLVASMLAQEGLEIVRNIRDENWIDISVENLDIEDWANSIADGSGIGSSNTDGTYVVDYNTRNEFGVSPNDTPDSLADNGTRLYYDNGTEMFTHASGGGNVLSPFRRLITAEYDHDIDANTNDLKVTCDVQWTAHAMTRVYTAETYFYDWR